MNSKFKEFWNEFTRNVDLDYVDPEEVAEKAWNTALYEARQCWVDETGFDLSRNRRKFDQNINDIVINND